MFLQVTKIDPENVRYNNLGNVLKNQKFLNSPKFLLQSFKDKSQFHKTILNLGNLNFELNKYDLAIELYKKALSLMIN